MLTMQDRPKERSMKLLSLIQRSDEQLCSPVTRTLCLSSPLTTPMSLLLEVTPPEETLF